MKHYGSCKDRNWRVIRLPLTTDTNHLARAYNNPHTVVKGRERSKMSNLDDAVVLNVSQFTLKSLSGHNYND